MEQFLFKFQCVSEEVMLLCIYKSGTMNKTVSSLYYKYFLYTYLYHVYYKYGGSIRVNNSVNVLQFEPNIQKGSESFVHHMLVYQCPYLSSSSSAPLKTSSMECEMSDSFIKDCRGTNVMAGWAIGGKVYK